MAPTIIALVLLALGVGIVVWTIRRKPGATTAARVSDETDTAWNDPITPGEPERPGTPPSQDLRP